MQRGEKRLEDPHPGVEYDEPTLEPEPGPGAWADWNRVIPAKEQITIDFAARDPLDHSMAVPVVRLVIPFGAAFRLRDALIASLSGYTDLDPP